MDQVSDQAQVQGEPDPDIRVGFTASRKVGGAVVRNRARRRLKAACAAILPSCGTAGRDYVIIARKSTATRPYGRLVDDLRTALKRIEDDRRSGQSGRRVENDPRSGQSGRRVADDRRSGHRQSRRSGGDG